MAGSVDEGNMQEGLGAWLLDSQDINICFSTSSMLPSSIEPEIISVTTVPSEKIFANPQAVVNDAGLAEGTGLNRKSVPKPKRKKHRPKVIKEGKAAKSQKSTTPKPPKEKGNQPTSKRKYVRRKGLNTPPKQLPSEDVDTNTRAEPSPARRFLNFDGKDRQENVDLSSQTQATEITTFPEDPRSSISAAERSHVQVGHHWSGTSSSFSAPFDPMANVQELPADSRENRVTFDLNNSVMNYMPSNFSDLIDGSGQNFQFDSRETDQINQLMDLYNGMPDKSVSHLNSSAKQMQNCSTNFDQYLYASQSSTSRPPRPAQMLHGYMMLENPAAPPQHVERVSMKGNFNPEACTRVNLMSQGYTVPENPIVPPKHSERDAVHAHFSELPVKNDYLKFPTNPSDQIGASFAAHDYHDLSHVHAIGKKREHNAINGHQVSFGVNFGHSSRESQFCNDPLSTSSQTYLSPETCKRMRKDDHRNWLNGLAGNFSSSSAYMSDNWDTNSVSTINHGPGVCTLADIQRLMALEKSRSSQQMIGFGVPENNIVQQHNKPTLDNNSGKYFAPPDKQLKYFTAQQTHFSNSTMNLLAENSTHRNGGHQLQALEIRPTEHYFSDSVVLPNEWSTYSTAGHTQFPSGTTNPSKENYIQSNRIHHLQPLENHMVKAPDLLFEPHKTSTEDVIVSNYCTDIPDEQIVITSAEVVRSVSQAISESAKTENCHLEHPRESTAPNPTDKPKVRGRPRKKEEPNGKPKVRGRPRKEAEPSGKLKVRGRPRKETEPSGKPKVRGRPRKETEPSGKSIDVDTIRKENVGRACPPNGDTDLNNESTSFASAPCAGIMPRMTTFESERNRERISISFATSEHDKYSSIRSEKIYRGSIYEVSAPSVGPLDAMIEKLKLLNLFESEKTGAVVQQNAIVPYEVELGALVPFEERINKKHSRPRVNIDPVTALVWNLLMEPDMCDGTERMDKDKEKWLDEERRVFRGRIDSFIARMHLVQGDRRFSRWKGSVVDSVVGVFLTQNVSDHLSSSAFMAVAAKFPAKSEDPEKPAFEMSHTPPEQKDSCSGLFGESIKMQGNFFVEEISEIRLNTTEDNEGSNSNELIGCSRDGVNREARECPVSYRKSLSGSHENGPAELVVPATATAGVVEVEDGSQEDVISSQNSAVSCQNSPDYLFHRTYITGSSSLPSFTEEDYIVRNMPNGMGSSTAHSALAPIQDLQSMPSEKVGLSEYHESNLLPTSCLNKGVLLDLNRTYQPVHTSYVQNGQFDLTGVSDGNHLDTSFLTDLDGVNISDVTQSEASLYQLPFDSITANRNNTKMPDSSSSFIYNLDGSLSQERCSFCSEPSQEPDFLPTVKQNFQQLFNSEEVSFSRDHSFCENRFSRNHTQDPFVEQHDCLNLQEGYTSRTKKMGGDQLQSGCIPQGKDIRVQATASEKLCSSNLTGNKNALSDVSQGVASDAIGKSKHSQKDPLEFPPDGSKARKVRGRPKKSAYDWDNLRKEVLCNYGDKRRSPDAKDTVDWEAVRQADVRDLSEAIRERGMNNMLAERIKEFLNRLVRDHGSIDLEWLRDVQPDKAKDYLLSIRGLGLKSVECIRLLTLHHMAFPVDTNVGRISVRLGWVPLQPLPESLQLHLLEMYPMLEHVQKYLWPRLCNLDQKTLYELHYQMITFGKVFCTKSKPNCNSCPMRAECKHFASAFASARLALPGPEEKSLVTSEAPNAAESCRKTYIDSRPAGQLEWNAKHPEHVVCGDQQPIVEEPSSPEPEPESVETEEGPIEDLFGEDPDEIPTIDLNVQEFKRNLKNYMQANNIEIGDDDMSKALVALTPQAASIPTSKLKNVSRLRTEHQVYELPDSHPLLEGFDKRQTDDPCPYLLSIWTPGETPQSTDAPKAFCNSQETGKLCESSTCFTCNSTREMHTQKVRGTILIPCRTAMRGSFPLNGTYFQVNEVFADHYSSQNPIDVWRSWIWNLPRRTVYFGTSVPTIFRGLVTEEIQQCFWRGFVCVRGFDRTLRAPKPLYARLHFPASKVARGRRPGAAREEE